MIHTDIITQNGVQLRHTYSDKYKILQEQTGIVYDDALDRIESEYTYTETTERKEDEDGADN